MPARTSLASRTFIATIFSLMLLTPAYVQAGHMGVWETAQQHRDRAAEYQKKAAEVRQDAEAHKKMLADYTVAVSPKSPIENSYIKNMRVHCEKYIKADEALAQEADEMAKVHELRAKEMEGK